MVVLGGKPEGRHTEQHDVFFGVETELRGLVRYMNTFWPALEGRMHIDSWRKVTKVDGYAIQVVPKSESAGSQENKLYFVNLGGYKPNDMEEYHYKQLVVASNLGDATRIAKETTFWKHHESSHIDDKYGIDVDDIYEVSDLLDPQFKKLYGIQITEDIARPEDKLEVGYLKISKLLAQG